MRRTVLLAGVLAAFSIGAAVTGGAARAQAAGANQDPHAGAEPPDDDDGPEPTAPSPHGGAGGAGGPAGRGHAATPGVFEPPPDTSLEDDTLPPGTIAVTVLDADDHPVPGTPLTLGILQNSVAKGESRRRVNGETDAAGTAVFSRLETASQMAYRVSVAKDGATFAATPFNLPPAKGIRVRLHVYPVTRDINQALVVLQVIVYAEMKDDRVQLQQAVTVYNFGRTAWLPDDVILALPEGFTALSGTQQMSDVGIDPVEKRGARLRGTFAPGRHDVEFRWQVPYDGEKDVTLDVGLPSHVAAMRVMAVASQQMKLQVDGFGPAQAKTDNQGQRILVTEKQLRREETPMKSAHIEIRDLPTAGPARWIATGLSGFGVVAGVGLAFGMRKPTRRTRAEGKAERAQLLVELEELERAHRVGEVGPKTYERARRELIDLLARTLAGADGGTSASTASAAPRPRP